MLHTKLCCWKTSKHVCSNAKHWWNNNQRSQYIKNSISYSLYAKKGSQLSPLWEIPCSKLGLKAGLGSFNKLQLSYRIAEWSANSYQLLGGWATKCSRPWLAATGLLRWELPPPARGKVCSLGDLCSNFGLPLRHAGKFNSSEAFILTYVWEALFLSCG